MLGSIGKQSGETVKSVLKMLLFILEVIVVDIVSFHQCF